MQSELIRHQRLPCEAVTIVPPYWQKIVVQWSLHLKLISHPHPLYGTVSPLLACLGLLIPDVER